MCRNSLSGLNECTSKLSPELSLPTTQDSLHKSDPKSELPTHPECVSSSVHAIDCPEPSLGLPRYSNPSLHNESETDNDSPFEISDSKPEGESSILLDAEPEIDVETDPFTTSPDLHFHEWYKSVLRMPLRNPIRIDEDVQRRLVRLALHRLDDITPANLTRN